MAHISYHASHEQFAPSALLYFAQLAEKAGFTACHSSDHFHPWSERQGHSGSAYTWLGAVMQATRFPVSFITAPGQRYHPAIVAQTIATLAEMFPDRLEVALGSGEALNESITGDTWPEKAVRNARLLESFHIIRRLLAGETVTHTGQVKTKEARLYSLPASVPPLFCAALSVETAHWAGQWAQGLLTVYKPGEELNNLIEAFRTGGGTGKPVHVQMAFSYARSKEDALEEAHLQWRNNVADPKLLADFYKVEQFDKAGEVVTPEDLKKKIKITSDPKEFIPIIQQLLDAGIDNVILHNVNTQQEAFVEDFGSRVLPFLNLPKH